MTRVSDLARQNGTVGALGALFAISPAAAQLSAIFSNVKNDYLFPNICGRWSYVCDSFQKTVN